MQLLLERTTHRVSLQQGSLGSFAALPLDVVAEIAGQADLGTVLALSRVNKSCRSLLVSKRMEEVWEQARKNAGLPKLTADNSPNLIELAELMYGTHCMVSRLLALFLVVGDVGPPHQDASTDFTRLALGVQQEHHEASLPRPLPSLLQQMRWRAVRPPFLSLSRLCTESAADAALYIA